MDLKRSQEFGCGPVKHFAFCIFMNIELLTPNVGSMGGYDATILLLMLLCGQFLPQKVWQ